MITTKRNKQTNKVSFYKNGKKVYPEHISGNIARFKNNELVKF